MENIVPNSSKTADLNTNLLNNGRFSNRAARFYWADEEPSPMRSYSIQQITKASSSDSHFEESPLVFAAISAGVIGVAIIIIILVGIWIRSRLFTEVERRSCDNANNMSVQSSLSTLNEEAYVVCMEMDGVVLGSMHNVANYCANDATIDMEPKENNTPSTAPVPEPVNITYQCKQSASLDNAEMVLENNDVVIAEPDDSCESKNESIAQ